jgi:hypothetical protein
VTDGGTTTTFISGGQPTHAAQAGDLTAVVMPVNLCRTNQAPAPGVCYNPPNRVGIELGYLTTDPTHPVGTDFAQHPGVSGFYDNITIDQTSTIDLTIDLSTVGQPLRWSWVNCSLLSWKTSGLGTAHGTVSLSMHLTPTPWETLAGQNGCSATPIFDCTIHQSAQDLLSGNLVLSVDSTMDAALTGAVFATQQATFGYLDPGSPGSASLSIQAGGPHLLSDGTLNSATISAFFPESAMLSIYSMTSADAASSIAVSSLTGTSFQSPSFASATASDIQDQGLWVTIPGVQFPDVSNSTVRRGGSSTPGPTWAVSSKATSVVGSAQVAGSTTKVSVGSVPKCPTSVGCKAYVFDLGPKSTKRSKITATLRSRTAGLSVTGRSLSWKVGAAKLPKNDRYLIEFKKGAKILSVATGVVR